MADIKKASSGANALVPYQSKVPSVIPSLGNLDAYIQAANRFPILSYEQERDLVERLHKNNDMNAGRALVMAHLRLVIAIGSFLPWIRNSTRGSDSGRQHRFIESH